MNKVLNKLLWVCIGVIIGAILFSTCKSKVDAPVIISTKEIKKDIAKAEDNYKQKFDSLLAKETALKSQSTNLTNKLITEIATRKQAEKLLDIWVSDLPDTVKIEVEKKINDYEDLVFESENTCIDLVANLNNQIAVKDTMLIAKDSLYSAIKRSLNLSLIQTDKLIDYSKQLQKQVKRKKAGEFVWKAVSFGLAAILVKQSLK